MSFKPGDKIIVHTCPRNNTELGWIGIVASVTSGLIWVKVDNGMYEEPISYFPKNIRKFSKLDKVLR